MGRETNQSEGRRDNQAVPAWEITKGAGKGGSAQKAAQPDGNTASKEAAALQNKKPKR